MIGKQPGRLRIGRSALFIPQSEFRIPNSKGFTLLEVILAIAVLAISLATIGEVMRLAHQNADLAAVESEAQILAESILGELSCGIRPAQTVEAAPLEVVEGSEEWQYSILVEPTGQVEIVQVRVLVESIRDNLQKPPQVELVQWFLNPETLPDATTAATGAATTGSSTGSVQ